jgi:uncharacterized membrane protein YesL
MLGKFLEAFFHRAYTILLLNLYFWLLSLIGALILGVGPAFLTLVKLFVNHGWDYKEIKLKTVFKHFKESFVRGNLFFYGSFLIIAVLGYNLSLSIQQTQLLFLMVDFLLIFAMIITTITFIYTLLIESKYETSLMNAWKLALMLFFWDFWTLVKFCAIICVIGWLTYHNPALILFGSFSLFTVISYYFSSEAFEKLESKLQFVS